MSATTIVHKGTVMTALLAIFVMSGFSGLSAMDYGLALNFNQHDLIFEQQNDFDVVKITDGEYLNNVGEPRLPAVELRIALPDGMKAEDARLENISLSELEGRYRIVPAQPPVRVSDYDNTGEYVQPDPAVYNSDKVYPEQSVTLVGQSDLAGQSFAIVKVCPFQYYPTQGKLMLMTSMQLVISGPDGYVCGDYLSKEASPNTVAAYRAQLNGLVTNRETVELRNSPLPQLKKMTLPVDGPFDHLIITTAALAPYWSDLVEWHTRKGVRDTVISTEYIYANYSGASNQEKIRSFLIDAHDNWGTLYVLMGGENSQVPFEYRTYVTDDIPSDEYYADYDNDWQMELLVGRVTASNQTEIARYIAKLMNYETDPPMLGYTLKATLLGMDLTSASQPPYVETPAEDTKELIDTSYIPSRFAVTKVYDSQTSNHYNDFVAALNAGAHLVNHADHSNTTIMGCGSINHNWYISNSTVDALTNTGKMSVIFSLGCHPNEMDYNDCIAEHFVVYNDLKGAVAFTGNTRSGWFYSGDPNSLSGVLDIAWWEGLFDQNMYRLGQTLAYAKQNSPHGDSYERYCQWTLNLLGEPEMPIWTDAPGLMVATFPDSVTNSPADFTVHVKYTYGQSIDSAYVCLWKAGSVFERGFTDANGDVTFSIAPSSGELYVTATKQNIIPYTGQSIVDVNNTPPQCVVPADSSIVVRKGDEVCLPVSCYDAEGNVSSGPTIVSGPGTIADGNWCCTPDSDEVCNVVVECQDDGGLICQTDFQITFNVYSCGDADGNGIVNVSDVVYLINFIFGGQVTIQPLSAGDTDCNQVVNISDAVYLLNYIFGVGEAPCDGC
jgi:hypothetical protein